MTAKFSLVILGSFALITPSHAGERAATPLQVSISKVERTRRWETPGPFPGTVGFVEAKEGQEILVLRLRVKSEGPIALNGFGIIDATGKKNEQCKTNIMGWEGAVPNEGLSIPFTIPKGLRVKKLVIRDPAMEINIPEKVETLQGKVAGVSMRTTSGPSPNLFEAKTDLSGDPKSTVIIRLQGKTPQEFHILTSDLVKIEGFTDLAGKHEMMGGLLILSDLQQRLNGKVVVLEYTRPEGKKENRAYNLLSLRIGDKGDGSADPKQE